MTSDALKACARWAAGGGDAPALGELPDGDWTQLLADAVHERLTGLVAAVIDEYPDLELERRDQAAARESEWTWHTLRAEQAMLRVTAAFDGAGIEHRVLKGSAFAHRHWPAPHLRTFADADVLVRSADVDRAVAVVLGEGGERLVPQLRRGFDRRFAKSVTMRDSTGVEIDLHRTLVAGPHAFLIPEVDLWAASPGVFTVARRDLKCFPPEVQLVHAATHAVASVSPRLASVLDMAFIAPHADLDEAAALAERWKLRAVICEAGTRVERVLGRDVVEVAPWAASLRPSPEEERLHDLFTSGRSFRRSAWAATPYIARRRDRVRFLASLALPSRAHRRAR